MKLIGYWMASLRDTHLPLPHELVGELPGAVREHLCEYLAGGELHEQYRGWSWCRFGCGVDGPEMGDAEYTDGEWVWPEGLVHYVRVHKIILPEEFVASALSDRRSRKPERGEVTLDYWIHWAEGRRSAPLRKRLASALAAAIAAEPAVLEAASERFVEDVRRRETESNKPCIYRGCSRFALAGRAVCARHMANHDQDIKLGLFFHYRLPDWLNDDQDQ